MLIDLPDRDTLYRALLDRDDRFDGQAFVCVQTTGIFCRLTCPARKPRPENCTFFATAVECLDAGYRPCRRCHPMAASAGADPVVKALLDALEAHPDARWSEQRISEMGFDVSTVRRSFQRQFGVTFLELARQHRIREGFGTLSTGGKVIAAQYDAGFESPSAFRAAFARLLGQAPGKIPGDALLLANWIRTPLGDMIAICCPTHLHLLEFVDRKALPTEIGRLSRGTQGGIGIGRNAPHAGIEAELDAYFGGRSAVFKTPLAMHGSPFCRLVWDELRKIPPGATRSYAEIARSIGRPTATRAVARATGANQIALAIPCHRVIGSDGTLTGYGGGLWRKRRLLEIERQHALKVAGAGRSNSAVGFSRGAVQ
jgi:AraC family transcriptional regulator, regulatory protein of adaptative response / methylated-DNA-[protein]-cysteine methyltransferase